MPSADQGPDSSRPQPWLGATLIVLGLGLALNSLLGPLFARRIDYPLSATLLNQTIGLEAFSLLVLAPLCVIVGWLALRGHRAAALMALGPAAYVVYMFVQYVIGPEYAHYPQVIGFHLALFVLGGAILLHAWRLADPLHERSYASARRWAAVLSVLAAFVVLRYVPALLASVDGDQPLDPGFADDVTMYWTIFLLDLGIVVPLTLATAVGLLRHASWAERALHAAMGWYALVPPSVALMAIVMLVNRDPNAALADVLVLSVAAVVFAALAMVLYRPLFGAEPRTERWPSNLFDPRPSGEIDERFIPLVETPAFRLEHIVSHGRATPSGEWYDQPRPEWVVLVRGRAVLRFEEGGDRALRSGDHLLIPARSRHRVDVCSGDAVWLALHFDDPSSRACHRGGDRPDGQ